MKAIFKKEITLFTKNKVNIITICILLLTYSLILFTDIFNLSILDGGYANIDVFFSLSPIIFLIYIPAISMRSFSEEYKNGTIDILLTKPIPTIELILSKYLSVLFIITLSIIPTIIYPLSVYFLGEEIGNIDLGSTIGSYIGLLLLCLAFTSISIFSSIVTRNQLNAFIIGVLLNIVSYYGFDILSQLFDNGQIGLIIKKIGILQHYDLLSKGLISFSDIIYFLSLSSVFLLFSNYIIKNKK